MLHSLLIKNYAIIESAELQFDAGLNIITGETGAGKSILLGALQLILGKRADLKVLYDKDKKCFVEGTFAIADYKMQQTFLTHDLEYEDEMIVRREISANGKSRAFINDTPVKLNVLSEITSQLVDLHQQFDTLDIHDAENQVRLLDTIAGNASLLDSYNKEFNAYKQAEVALEKAVKQMNEGKKEVDYIKFQLDEFDAVRLVAGEQGSLEQELSSLEHAEEIQSTIGVIANRLENGEQTITNDLADFIRQLGRISKYHKDIEPLLDRLNVLAVDLSDVSQGLIDIASDTEMSPTRLEEVKERIDTIYRLQNKHGVQSVEALLLIFDQLAQTFDKFSNSEEYIESLTKELTVLEKQAKQTAEKLSKKRHASVKKTQKDIQKMLADLAMGDAVLKIDVKDTDSLSKHGTNEIQFLFSANKGSAPIALKKVASGGELSRLNLSLKALMADKTNLPTLVFDEIDTGISGEVANRMGHILSKIGSAHQVVVITHSPQVAARGNKHLFVYKETKAKETHTYLKELNSDGRVVEIAKMLSGDPPSQSALLNAKELIES